MTVVGQATAPPNLSDSIAAPSVDPPTVATLNDVVQQLEGIRDVPNTKYRKSIEGTLWMLRNRTKMVASAFVPTDKVFSSICVGQNLSFLGHRSDLLLDHGSPQSGKHSSFSCLSPLSTTDSSDTIDRLHFAAGQYSHSLPGQRSSISSSQITHQTAILSSKAQWKPSSWFLRTSVPERRHSGDAIQYKSIFQRRCKNLARRFRRRKTISKETLQLAAAQAHQVSLIRDSTSHHSNPIASGAFPTLVPYRRSQSAVTFADVSIMTESPGAMSSRNISRKHSLSSLNTFTEVWPESITGLLTGGQLLIDRSILFNLLSEELKATSKSDSSWNNQSQFFCRDRIDSDMSTRKTSGLSMISGGVSIPRPDKKWGGEDAFFVSDHETKFSGVADGVGEWGELGCNPRQFAEELMEGAKEEASILGSQSSEDSCCERASIRAQRALAAGFQSAKSFGSSTAIVAGLDAEGRTLGVANIGDSACLVLRRESKHHRHFIAFRRTKEQQHFFNCPYQLSKVPHQEDLPQLESQGMHALVRALGSLSCLESDTPEMADLYDIRVQEGDLVILATDGVFDNLFDHEIATLVSLAVSPREASALSSILSLNRPDRMLPHPNAFIPPVKDERFGYSTPAQNIAQAVAEAAFYRSVDARAKTPFARQSRKAGGFSLGGKMDDITCVAAWIV